MKKTTKIVILSILLGHIFMPYLIAQNNNQIGIVNKLGTLSFSPMHYRTKGKDLSELLAYAFKTEPSRILIDSDLSSIKLKINLRLPSLGRSSMDAKDKIHSLRIQLGSLILNYLKCKAVVKNMDSQVWVIENLNASNSRNSRGSFYSIENGRGIGSGSFEFFAQIIEGLIKKPVLVKGDSKKHIYWNFNVENIKASEIIDILRNKLKVAVKITNRKIKFVQIIKQ